MLVTSDFLTGVVTRFTADFDSIQAQTPVVWNVIGMEVPSGDKEYVQFNWVGAPPRVVPFRATYDIGKSYPHDYQVRVSPRGVILEIARDAFRRNPLNTIALHVNQLQEQAVRYYDEVLFAKLSAGFTENGFDGVTFYNASHTFGSSAAYDNVDTAALNADGVAFTIGYAAIMTAQDDQGRALGYIPSHLVYFPTNWAVAKRLLEAQAEAAGATNIFRGVVTGLPAPYLATPTEWHILAASGSLKPTALVVDEPIAFVAQVSPESDANFERRAVRVKVECQIAPAFGDPRLAWASDGTI